MLRLFLFYALRLRHIHVKMKFIYTCYQEHSQPVLCCGTTWCSDWGRQRPHTATSPRYRIRPKFRALRCSQTLVSLKSKECCNTSFQHWVKIKSPPFFISFVTIFCQIYWRQLIWKYFMHFTLRSLRQLLLLNNSTQDIKTAVFPCFFLTSKANSRV